MGELKTNLIQKPVENEIRCAVCAHITRCNYNLTGRSNPLCEDCYIKGLPQLPTLVQVHEVSNGSYGLTFRIFRNDEKKFLVEVDELCRKGHRDLHHPLVDKDSNGIFDSQAEAQECIDSFVRRI